MWFFDRFFTKHDETTQATELLQTELGELKKILRKQSMVIEMFKNEVIEHIDTKSVNDTSLDSLKELGDSFFYLEKMIVDSFSLSASQEESFSLAWSKIEKILNGCNLELIREAGVPFHARIHEAVGEAAVCSGELYVTAVLQPGYLYRDKVIRPAKVVTGELQE